MFDRSLNVAELIKERSFFLFGARQTGKTTLLKSTFPNARFVNLNEADTFRRLSAAPERLRQSLSPEERLVIIDEVQRLPSILPEIQVMMDNNPSLRFILTSSSARSLRHSGVNLLGGRARVSHLYPITSAESSFLRIADQLSIGGLPPILNSTNPWADLEAYVGIYLQEEIRAEGLVRSIENFSRLLEVAAQCNCEQINFTKIAADLGMPARTVREHFQILEDTLVATLLPPFRKTVKRKPVATSKFYFFDVGVTHGLSGRRKIPAGTSEYGKALEQLIFLELKAYLAYSQQNKPLTYWRTQSQQKVDFIIGDSIAIEIKASTKVSERDCKNLTFFSEEFPAVRKIIISNEIEKFRFDNGVEVFPVKTFLEELWSGYIVVKS